MLLGFPGSSVLKKKKKSSCNAGDSNSIPGLGRSPGEGTGYPLQYSGASPIAQLVKNLPPTWETWVQSFGWEDPLEEGWQPTPVSLPGKSPWTEEPGGLQSMGSQRVRHAVCVRHCSTFTMQREIKRVLPHEMYSLVVFTCKQTIDRLLQVFC